MRVVKLSIAIVTALIVAGCTTQNGTNKLEKSKTVAVEKVAKPEAKTVASSRPLAPRGKTYSALIAKHARANGVPVKLAHAVVYSESSYRSSARGAAGEIGLMQLRLPTARLMGYRGSAKALYNPDTNLAYGMKYLGQAHKLAGGNTCGTILRYNAGLGAKRMNPISARYCRKVRRLLN